MTPTINPERLAAASERFHELRESRGKMVRSLVIRFRADEQDVEDYVSAIWKTIWEALLEDPKRETLSRWIFRIAKNEVFAGRRNELMHHGDERSLEEIADAAEDDDGRPVGQPEMLVAEVEHASVPDLREALAALPPDLQELMKRHHFGGETLPEISADTGIGIRGLESRVSAAYELLRTAMKWQAEVKKKKRPQQYSHKSAERKRDAVGSMYTGQATVTRERLDCGGVIFAHRKLDPLWLEIEAQRWRHNTVPSLVITPEPKRPPALLPARAPNGLSARIKQLLDADPELTVARLVELTAGKRESVRTLRAKILRQRASETKS